MSYTGLVFHKRNKHWEALKSGSCWGQIFEGAAFLIGSADEKNESAIYFLRGETMPYLAKKEMQSFDTA